jgi:hypothetical protein
MAIMEPKGYYILLEVLDMEEKKTNKVKEFVEKHKTALIITGAAAVGIVGSVMLKKTTKFDLNNINWDDYGLLGKVVKVEQKSKLSAWFENEGTDVRYKVADLGKVGEDLMALTSVDFKAEDQISGILIYTE